MSILNKSCKIRKAHEDLGDSFVIPRKIEDDLYRNKNGIYFQPARAVSVQQRKTYKPFATAFDSETIYRKSYIENKVSKVKHAPKKNKNVQITGKVDYKTTSHMSYQGHHAKPVDHILPTNHLKCGGCGDFTSTYSESYFKPITVKTLPIKPIRGKVQYPVQMEFRTTMTESFQDPGVKLLKRDVKKTVKPKCKVFVSDAKIDCWTTNRNSYNMTSFQKRQSYRPKRCQVFISSKMEADSIYKSSYKLPGYCL